MGGQMEGQTDGQTEEQTDIWMEERKIVITAVERNERFEERPGKNGRGLETRERVYV